MTIATIQGVDPWTGVPVGETVRETDSACLQSVLGRAAVAATEFSRSTPDGGAALLRALADAQDTMQHGGPRPATTSAAFTSVGATAIQRWIRPVCCEDVPESLLPPALRTANPWRLPRRIDGRLVVAGGR